MKANEELQTVVSRPEVSNELVKEILKEYFHFDATDLKNVVSFYDKNIFFKVSNEGPDISSHGYVLKILNEAVSLNSEYIDGTNKMAFHVNQTVLPSSIPIKNINGDYMFHKSIPCLKEDGGILEEGKCLIRVLKFIPGTILTSVPFTRNLYFHCGEMVAKITKSLMNFSNEDIENFNSVWSIEHVPSLCNLLEVIDDISIRDSCKAIMEKFEVNVIKNTKNLPRVITHSDLNDQNILVDKIDGEYKWCGLLDFGDVCYSYAVFEISILVAHLMYACKTTDILDIGGHCLAGYLTNHALSKLEIDMVLMCIKGRMLQAVIIGSQTQKKFPENDYVKEAVENGWKLLQMLIEIDEDEIMKRWWSIIEGYDLKIPS